MSERFQDRYRIPSARASWWDYGRNAPYFVTICTEGRECYFGNIVETKFIASPVGEIAQSCWQEIPQHFPYVQLDSFVVMPNHVHGILMIDKRIGMIIENESKSGIDDWMCEKTNDMMFNTMIDTPDGPVKTLHATSLPLPPMSLSINPMSPPLQLTSLQIDPASEETPIPPINIASTPIKNEFMSSISPKWGTLGSIVRSYKSAVSKKAHFINPNFGWQTRFYETIIRNQRSYQVKSAYIHSNPSKWKDDQFYIN